MENKHSSSVLIVGGGPSGLVAGLTLLRNGIPVRIVEKADKFHVGQRGAGIQPRSLEIFNFLGVSEIITLGERIKPMCSYELPGGKEPKSNFELKSSQEATPDVPFINPLMLGQNHSEEILRTHIESYGARVELNTELISFEQDADGVTAHLIERDGGSEVHEDVHTPFLIGADGAKGITRKQLGLTFLGESRPSDHILFGDLYVEGLDTDHWHFWGDFLTKMVTLRPTEYKGRFFVAAGGRDIDYKPLLADREAFFKFIVDVTNRDDLVFGDLIELNNFSPNIRMVNKFGEGRIFVVGGRDAAHIHSPTGGQGMNSSIQDSFNLGWKVALVYKGLAPLSLLSTYSDERVPVIRQMLESTTEQLNRTLKANVNSQDPESYKSAWKHPDTFDQLGVNYRWSSIVIDERQPFIDNSGDGAHNAYGGQSGLIVCAGDRAPDAPGLVGPTSEISLFDIFKPVHHTALLFVSKPDEAKGVLGTLSAWSAGTVNKVIVVPKGVDVGQLNFPGADLVLEDKQGHAYDAYGKVVEEGYTVLVIRPDGVIGAVLKGVDGLKRYYQGIFSDLNALN